MGGQLRPVLEAAWTHSMQEAKLKVETVSSQVGPFIPDQEHRAFPAICPLLSSEGQSGRQHPGPAPGWRGARDPMTATDPR